MGELKLSNETLSALRARGLVQAGFPAGLRGFPEETVFLPGAFDVLNGNATFRLVPPSF